MSAAMRRTRAAAYWITPPVLALILYWPGVTAWFQRDDFAWLGLRGMVHNWRDLRWALFAPLAQGTLRILSERVFYLSSFSLFGMHALPYHCLSFLTYTAALVLLIAVCIKLTGSRAAGFWAAILWSFNRALAIDLSWTSTYSSLLAAFFLLLTLWFLIRYAETGQRRYWVGQWITFIAGFGVLELNVVYPALAAAYAVCYAPRLVKKVLPLFAVSAAYTLVHVIVAPLPEAGPYKGYWDFSILSTLWTYWKMALGPNRLIVLGVQPSFWRSLAAVLLMAGLLWFLAVQLHRGRRASLFFPAWFVIVIAPLLPLRNHISDYYLTIPLIGLAMWGGWAVASGWRSRSIGKAAAAIVLGLYLLVTVPVARATADAFSSESQRIHNFVLEITKLSRAHPGKAIVLTGVGSAMFWDAIFHHPFRPIGAAAPLLAAENRARIDPYPRSPDTDDFFIDPARERRLFAAHAAVLYNAETHSVQQNPAQ